jgi:hypothetical protein
MKEKKMMLGYIIMIVNDAYNCDIYLIHYALTFTSIINGICICINYDNVL